jgi:hypothetical protein
MATQTLIWTALPNGFTKDKKSLRVSVLLSPRLVLDADDGPTLSSFFPDWEDWPATLANAIFHITFGSDSVSIHASTTSGPNCVDTSIGAPDSQIWTSLFKGGLPVEAFHYNKELTNNLILSYDTIWISSKITDLYRKLAQNAIGNMPVVSDILNDPDWSQLVAAVSSLDRKFMDEDTGLRNIGRQYAEFFQDRLADETPQGNEIIQKLSQFQLFHTPPARPKVVTQKRSDDERITARWMEYERAAIPEAEDLAKLFDFHKIIASMNSYPTIMRKLGLVVDFLLDPNQFKESQDSLSISTELDTEIQTTHSSLVTRTMLSSSRFQAVSDPTPNQDDIRTKDRLLDINQNQYDLLQMDVDGAGLKLMNFARTLAKLLEVPSRIDTVTRFEKEIGVPALRNAGLMLAHRNRWSMLTNKFTTNDKLEAGTTKELWAEDILRGFRIDIWDNITKHWHSLCRRNATYHPGDGPNIGVHEESIVRLAATKSADPTYNKDLMYLHEALVSWTGWSLGAPPPGRAIKNDDTFDTGSTQTEAELPPGFAFETRFKPVAGSLPRLRYGREYRIRARAVDLAGNSLEHQPEDFGSEKLLPARKYFRYEPIAAPIIALVKPKGGLTEAPAEGESMERIAIRSFNNDPTDNSATSQIRRRYAVPPQSSVREAELHGKLDIADGLDKTKFDMLANQKDLDAADANAALIEESLKISGPLSEESVETKFAVYRDGEDMTYLPDPMAEQVCVRIFDHPAISDTQTIKIPLYPTGKWPDAQPFKIVVLEDSGNPKYDSATHSLLVPLSKAIRAKIRLSMGLSDESLLKMGVWDWIANANLINDVKDGKHWMLTPWRTVEVVHAVQRPLITPEISKLTVRRHYASTTAVPAFIATCSLKSTDRLYLLSEWHEPKDDPENESQLKDQKRGDVAFSIKVTDPKSYALKLLGHDQGGYPDHLTIGEDMISVNMAKLDLAPTKDHEFRDTRYRRIEYWLEGTTRFREYMPTDILTETVGTDTKPTEKNIKVTGPRSVTWVPCSAPPPAPSVLYVVPTFGWLRTSEDTGNKYSMRRGRGLRVYLDRPWNVSGYGEMLAVLLPPQSFTGEPNDEPKDNPYKNYVTQWGNDPIWLSSFVPGKSPRRNNFPLARTAPDSEGKWLPEGAPPDEKDQPPGPFQVTDLKLPGAPLLPAPHPVEIAPHDVFYDKQRRLWYCDIEINSGSAYFPFVRLALARYQPVAVSNEHHLSNAVLADFMALAPDRWLNITQVENEKVRRITVYGQHYTDSSSRKEAKDSTSYSEVNSLTNKPHTFIPADVSGSSVFEVWLERLDKNLGEDFGWQRIAEATAKQPKPEKKGAAKLASKSLAGEFIKKHKFDALFSERLVESAFAFPPLYDGEITLPAMQGERYRLVIAEYEEYLVDDNRPYDGVPEKKDKRLVFIEHVELN